MNINDFLILSASKLQELSKLDLSLEPGEILNEYKINTVCDALNKCIYLESLNLNQDWITLPNFGLLLKIIAQLPKLKELKIGERILNINPTFNAILHWAVRHGNNPEFVKTLLTVESVKANAHAHDNQIFQISLTQHKIEIAKMLLQLKGVRDNAHVIFDIPFDLFNETDIEIFKMLLQLDNIKANAHANDNEILRWVVGQKENNVDFVELLLQLDNVKAKANAKNNEALRKAIESGHIEIVKMLLKLSNVKANAHANDNEALHIAVAKGQTEVVELLLQLDNVKAKADAKNNGALRIATTNGQTKIVKMLLQLDNVIAKDDANDNEALRIAVAKGQTEVVELLLQLDNVKAKADANDNEALRKAAIAGHTEIFKMLLQLDNVKAKADANDNEALRKAAIAGHTEIFKLLLQLDNVKVKADANDNEALLLAARNGYIEIVKMLLQLDNVKVKADVSDNYALRKAAIAGHTEIVKMLLSLKNVRDSIMKLFKDPSVYSSLSKEIMDIIFPYATLYGLPFKVIFNDIALAEISKNPADYLANLDNIDAFYSSFPEHEKPFSLDKLIILKILQGRQAIKDAEAAFHQNSETAMASHILKAANIAYEKAEKLYGKLLEEKGGIEKVEQKIRQMLLEKILAREQKNISPKSQEIVKFIEDNKATLMLGNDENLMSKARTYFKSNTDNHDVAWRSYDQFAPVSGGWDNLLTLPRAEKNVYAAGVNEGESELSLKKASDDARKRVVLYYLALLDQNKSFTLDFPTREAIFIGQLADIRRAHNNLSGDDLKNDDPSCYPGTIGRILTMGAGHPELDIPDPITLSTEFIKDFLRGVMKKWFLEKYNNDVIEQEKLCLAISVFNDLMIQDLKEGKKPVWELSNGKEISLAELGAIYQDILKQIANDGSVLIKKVNDELAKRNLNKKEFATTEQLYPIQQWLELTAYGVGNRIAEEFDPTKVSPAKKEEVFNYIYPIFSELLSKSDLPEEACAYLLKKCIDLTLEPKDAIHFLSWRIEREILQDAYRQYQKTGYSKEIPDAILDTFLEKLNITLQEKEKESFKTEIKTKAKTWNELEELASKLESVKKIVKDLDKPFSVSAQENNLKRLEQLKALPPVQKKQRKKLILKEIEKLNKNNVYFAILFKALTNNLVAIKNKDILAFLAKQLAKKIQFEENNLWNYLITPENLNEVYNKFKSTDQYQKIEEMEPENIKTFSEKLSIECKKIANESEPYSNKFSM